MSTFSISPSFAFPRGRFSARAQNDSSRRPHSRLFRSRTSLKNRQGSPYTTSPFSTAAVTSDSSFLHGGIISAAAGAIAFAGWKIYLYFQLEFVTASLIGNHIPKGGARVLQIGGGTREFYYYPEGTIQVTVTQSSTAKGVLENGGIAAKIPVVVRESANLKTSTRFNLGSPASYDAVIMLNIFSKIQNPIPFLQELGRSLKPEGVLITVDKDKQLARMIEENDLYENVGKDIALEGQDEHVVTVSTRGTEKRKSGKASIAGFSDS